MLAQELPLAYIIKHIGLDLEEETEGFVDALDDQSTPSSPMMFVSLAITLDSYWGLLLSSYFFQCDGSKYEELVEHWVNFGWRRELQGAI